MKVSEQRKTQEKEAASRAAKLGHELSEFATSYGDRVKAYSEAYCLNCPAVAVVNVKGPEGRQIGGIATILQCDNRTVRDEVRQTK